MVKQLSIIACGIALGACSSSGDLMRTATPTVPLQFESDPPGAEVKTSGGQTCRTPCALAIPAADFQVTYSLSGFQPQTIPVKLLPPDDIRGSEEMGLTGAPPRFTPSPVVAELVKAGPVRRAPARKAPVAKRQPAAPTASGDAPPPQRAQRTTPQPSSAGGAAPSTSGFNPPPQNTSGGFGRRSNRHRPPAPGRRRRRRADPRAARRPAFA